MQPPHGHRVAHLQRLFSSGRSTPDAATSEFLPRDCCALAFSASVRLCDHRRAFSGPAIGIRAAARRRSTTRQRCASDSAPPEARGTVSTALLPSPCRRTVPMVGSASSRSPRRRGSFAQFALDRRTDESLDARLFIEGGLLEFSLHRLRYADGEEDDFFVDGVLFGGWHRDVLPVSRTAQR